MDDLGPLKVQPRLASHTSATLRGKEGVVLKFHSGMLCTAVALQQETVVHLLSEG